MLTVFVLMLSVALISAKGILTKLVSQTGTTTAHMLVIFAVAGVVSAMMGAFWGFSLHASTILIALGYSLGNFSAQYFYLKAMKGGKTSTVVFIYSCNFAISSLFSLIAYKESLTIFRILGILMICAALGCFCINQKDHQTGQSGKTWLLLGFVAMLCGGTLGIFQKLLQHSPHPQEVVGMSAMAGIFSTLLSAAMITGRGGWKASRKILSSKRTILLCILCGITHGTVNVLATQLVQMIDGAIVFPILNCGSIVLTMICTRILFKDKLSRMQIAGIAIGLTAIGIINM